MGLATAGLRAGAAAQDATPAPEWEKTEFLFLQSYQYGRIAPETGDAGRYILTLAEGLGQTIYFYDRPEHAVVAVATPRLLDGLGFPSNNSPNAALVVEPAPGETGIATRSMSPRQPKPPPIVSATETRSEPAHLLSFLHNDDFRIVNKVIDVSAARYYDPRVRHKSTPADRPGPKRRPLTAIGDPAAWRPTFCAACSV